MYDDPEVFLGAVVMVVVASGLAWLLYTQLRDELRTRSFSLTSMLGASASLCVLWFIAWAITGGFVPHGLIGLCAASLLVLVIVARGNTRR